MSVVMVPKGMLTEVEAYVKQELYLNISKHLQGNDLRTDGRTMHDCRCLFLIFTCLLGGIAFAGPPAELQVETFEGLEVGDSVSRERPVHGVHEYLWDFPGPRYLRGMVHQGGVDLRLRWVGPGGEVLGEVDGGGTEVEENFALRASQTGEYRLQIVPKTVGEAPGGSYVFKLYELHEPRPGDAERVEAWKGFQRGRCVYQQGRTDEARAAFEATLRRFEELGDPQGEAAVLQQLGWLVRELQQSKRFYEDALARLGRDAQSALRYDILADLASVETDLGNMPQALTRYQESLEFFKLSGNDSSRADTLSNMGLLLRDMGDDEAARDALEEALGLHRALGRDRAWEVRTLNSLGLLAQDLGDLPQALERFEQARRLAREIDNAAMVVRARYHIGSVHRSLGELQEALRLLEQVRLESEEMNLQATLFSVQLPLAMTWMEIGDLERAFHYAERAVELSRMSGSPVDLVRSLSALAFIHLAAGEPKQARRVFETSLEPSRRSNRPFLQAQVLMGLARCKRILGHPEEAVRLVQDAQEEATRSNLVPLQIAVMVEQGDLQRELGDFDKARRAFDDAEDLAQATSLTSYEPHILARRSRLKRAQGSLEEAREEIEEALERYESLRNLVGSSELRAYFLAHRLDDYQFYVEVLLDLHDRQPDAGYDALALAASERARARTLVELLTEVRVDPNRDLPEDVRRRLRNARSRLTKVQHALLSQLVHPEPDPELVTRYQQEREEVLAELDLLELEVQQGSRKLVPKPLDLAGIQALLAPETALLEYVVGTERLYLFVVTENDLKILRLPRVDELAASLRAFRKELMTPGLRKGALYGVSHELYLSLLAPAMEHLEDVQNLLIIPTADLFYVPFEALRTEPPQAGSSPQAYVVSRWSITYAPSATTLAALEKREEPPAQRLELVAFANSAAENHASSALAQETTRSSLSRQVTSFQPLAQVEAEVRSIARLFPEESVSLYVDEDASEKRVKESLDLRRARRVHFATHGVVNEQRPAYSALYLKHALDGSEDGLLQVHEIFDLHLSADLVMLSACETGLGKQVRGEGLLGLYRAFFYAGAPLLGVSLWKVDDASTAKLMTSFYRHLKDQKAPADALRKAQLEMIQQERWAHPYYWAPFILVGA